MGVEEEKDDKRVMIVLHENKYVDVKMYNVATNTLQCLLHYQSPRKWTSHRSVIPPILTNIFEIDVLCYTYYQVVVVFEITS